MKRARSNIEEEVIEGNREVINTKSFQLGPVFLDQPENIDPPIIDSYLVLEGGNIRMSTTPAVGPPGPPGPAGPAGTPGTPATVAAGATVTGAPATPASVVNSGTPSNAIFDFTIPQGVAGTSYLVVQELVTVEPTAGAISPVPSMLSFTGTVSPPSIDGITAAGSNINITKRGFYTVQLNLHLDRTSTVFVQLLVDGVPYNSSTATIASVLAGVETARNSIFEYFNPLDTARTLSFRLVGDSYPVTGTPVAYGAPAASLVYVQHWSTS